MQSLNKIDHQQLAWLRYERNPALFKKAEKIIEALKGEGCWLRELEQKHEIYRSYFFTALRKLGYSETRRRGTPSVGLDFFYERNSIEQKTKKQKTKKPDDSKLNKNIPEEWTQGV